MLQVLEVGDRNGSVFQISGILVSFYFPAAGTQLCTLQPTTQQGTVLSGREKEWSREVLVGCTCCPKLGQC